MSDEADVEELKEEFGGTSATGDRLETAATTQETADLTASILEELEAIEAGERQKTVSVWDGSLAALLGALETHDAEREALVAALRDALDAPAGNGDRSEILRLALRLGIQEAAPEYLDAIRDATREQTDAIL